jgi:hypothetical protein
MSARLTSAMLVSALIRRVGAEGGNAAVLAKGDATAGAILLICMEKGVVQSVRERVLDRAGAYAWTAVGPAEPDERTAYLERRRARDPDLWLVELDIANAERFAAETGDRD